MSKIQSAVQFAVNIANDNSHGYSQADRWGPDYDCSSLVIAAWQQAGVPVKSAGASYTGNMRGPFMRNGFDDVTSQVNLATGAGLQYGDVLLNYSSHTAMFIGGGRVVHARSSEGNSIPGDQSGNEVRCQSYWNYPWDCVLRYTGNDSSAGTASPVSADTPSVPASNLLRKGMTGTVVKEMQELLIKAGEDCGPDGADGDFGNNTYAAVISFQKKHNLEQDGIVGDATMKALKAAAASAKTEAHTEKTETPAAPSDATPTEYTVQKGDALWNIAAKYLGAGGRYTEIMALNGLTSTRIYAGQVLKLPNANSEKPAEDTNVPATDVTDINVGDTDEPRIYTVKEGDTLWAIARDELGDYSRFEEIKAINGLVSSVIYVGERLKLPKK